VDAIGEDGTLPTDSIGVIIEISHRPSGGKVVMIKERGVVEKIVHQRAVIKLHRSSGCDTCEARGSCHADGEKEMLVEVENELRVKEGDFVELSIPARSVAKMALVVYLGPVAALIAGAFAGDALGKSFQLNSPLAPVIGGVALLAASLLALKAYDRFGQSRPEYHPHMTRVLATGPGPSSPPSGDSR
jgi:sigma-E factor negative regulatory protein RseC